MKFLLATLLTAALAFLAGLYTPWWSIAIVTFLVAVLIRQNLLSSFLSGFFGIFLCWGVLALWIDVKNNHVLSQKIARVFPLGGSWAALILVTGLVGALVGGFAALSGGSLHRGK